MRGRLLHQAAVPSDYAHLRALWARLPGCRIEAVYKAGFSGFGLHDQQVADGIAALVTPPSKVSRSGDRVKTDRLDAQALARHLETGQLRACRVLDTTARQARDHPPGEWLCAGVIGGSGLESDHHRSGVGRPVLSSRPATGRM